jgi:hypothetical protein
MHWQENILKSVSRAGTIQFSLHPSFKAKNHVNEVSITRNDGSGEQENRRPPTAESNEAAKEESTREWVDVKSQSNHTTNTLRLLNFSEKKVWVPPMPRYADIPKTPTL